MKYFFSLVFLLALGAGCKPKESPDAKLEKKLMETMKNYLDEKPHPGIAFTVKDVVFYAGKNYYTCEFHVNKRSDKKDTTGVMAAFISNDFTKVERTQ